MNQYPVQTMICALLGELLSDIEASQPMFSFTTHMDPESEARALATDGLSIYIGKHQGNHFTLWVPVTFYAENVTIGSVGEATKSYVGRLFLNTLENNIDVCKGDHIYACDFTVLQEALTVVRPFIEQHHLSAAISTGTATSTNRIKI
ncbi:TPA: hypothetical protein QDB31_005461 [Burkholderia vietnamiensis]|nr:hypothetical protein [Burkholderia vietnamiensis]